MGTDRDVRQVVVHDLVRRRLDGGIVLRVFMVNSDGSDSEGEELYDLRRRESGKIQDMIMKHVLEGQSKGRWSTGRES